MPPAPTNVEGRPQAHQRFPNRVRKFDSAGGMPQLGRVFASTRRFRTAADGGIERTGFHANTKPKSR
jgi:hypothetical protein